MRNQPAASGHCKGPLTAGRQLQGNAAMELPEGARTLAETDAESCIASRHFNLGDKCRGGLLRWDNWVPSGNAHRLNIFLPVWAAMSAFRQLACRFLHICRCVSCRLLSGSSARDIFVPQSAPMPPPPGNSLYLQFDSFLPRSGIVCPPFCISFLGAAPPG